MKEDIVALDQSSCIAFLSIASKATGYLLRKLRLNLLWDTIWMNCKTKLQINFGFIRTDIDYVIVKIPRWNFDKFEGADRTLGLQMKSVGEVMELDVRSKSCTKTQSLK
jgi:carbamoyl-phosphate synthase large subunit